MTLSGDGAAAAIRQAASSLRSNPDQFTYSVTVIGTQATGGPGGPGIVAQAWGGMPGSSAIGYNAGGMNDASVTIAQGQADAAVNQRLEVWATELEKMADLVEQKDAPQARTLLNRVMNMGLPAAVTALVSGLVNLAF